MTYRKFILFPLLVFALITCSGQADDVIAYRGATIETVAKAGTIKNGTVLLRSGKIEAVGTDVDIPIDAKVVDVSGQTIMPALVDIYHPITISGLTPSSGGRTIVFRGRVITVPGSRSTSAPAYAKLSDVVDPLSLKSDFNRLSRFGVGFTNLVTRGYGQSLHAKVSPNETATSIINPDGGLFLSVTNSTASLDVLRKGLKGSTSTSRSSTSSSPNSTTALWTAVKEGKTPLVLNVNNAAAIIYVLQIQKEYDKVRTVLVASGANIYQSLNQLKVSKLSVLIRAAIDTAPRSHQRINIAKLLADAKIEFGFSSSLDSSLNSMPDTPLFPVSQLVKTGLSKERALKALTLAPAKMLGIEKTLGSIEVGKQANLLFLNGTPFDAGTTVQQLLVEGESVYENQ